MIGSFRVGWRRLAAPTMSLSMWRTWRRRRDSSADLRMSSRRLVHAAGRPGSGWTWYMVVPLGCWWWLVGVRGCAGSRAVTGSGDRGVEATRGPGRRRGAKVLARQATTGARPPRRPPPSAFPAVQANGTARRSRGDDLRRFDLQHVVPSFRLLVSGTSDDLAPVPLDTNEFRGGRCVRPVALDSLAHGADRVPVAARLGDGRSRRLVERRRLLAARVGRRGSARRCSSTTSSTSAAAVARRSPPSATAG